MRTRREAVREKPAWSPAPEATAPAAGRAQGEALPILTPL